VHLALFVLGSLAYDTIITPFGRRDRILGGSAAFVSLSASLFSNDIYIISVIGNDFKQEFLDIFHGRGISTKYVKHVYDKPTFYWAGKYLPDMNNRETLVTEINALSELSIPEKVEEKCDILVLSTASPHHQKEALLLFKNQNPFVIMDTISLWITTMKKELEEVVGSGLVDMLCINDVEARIWSGEYSLRRCAKYFLDMGAKYMVIKKGENGALLFWENNAVFFPALPLEDVKDPTGAGDSFVGGIAGFLYSSGDFSLTNIQKGIVVGSVVASFCVEEFGVERLLTLTHNDINERLEHFKTLMSVYMVI